MITANHSSFKINGSKYLYILPFTVLELMNYLGFNQKVIVVDYNGFILEKSQWEKNSCTKPRFTRNIIYCRGRVITPKFCSAAVLFSCAKS